LADASDTGQRPIGQLEARARARLPNLAELARHLLGADAALITFTRDDAEAVVVAVGTDAIGTMPPAGDGADPVVVADTHAHPQLARHPLCTEHGFGFYVAIALRPEPDQPALGSLHVLAYAPRPQGVEPTLLEPLRLLGATTAAMLDAAQALWRCQAERANDRAMVDAMTRCEGIGIALTDSQNRFLHVNDTLARLLDTTAPALHGSKANAVIGRRIHAVTPTPLQQTFHTGEPSSGYWRTRTPGGKYRILRNFTERLSLPDGARSLAILLDVTAEHTQQAMYSLTAAVLEMVISERPAGAILRRIGAATRDYRPDAAVLVLQRQGDRLRRKFGSALPAGLEPRVRSIPLGIEGPAAEAIAKTEPVIISDLDTDQRWPEHRRILQSHGLRAAWIFPFLGEDGEARGVLGLLLPMPETPDASEISFLADVATLAGLALSREHLLRALREQVVSDPLTGLGNRTLLEDRMERQLQLAQREGVTAAVMLLDLDNFKVVNDTFGHDVGDDLLVTVGERLSDNLRTSDTLARLGGDEFVVLLPGCDWEGVERVARGIVQALAEPIATEAGALRISPSIGITLMTRADYDVDAVLKRADDAMYAAKGAGRNTFRCEPGPSADAGDASSRW
jgi:diguanylate cyclase (GGDEF)-like protein